MSLSVTINSVGYTADVGDSESLRRKPVAAEPDRLPIASVLVGKDGTRNKMHYGFKLGFRLRWEKVPQVTRDALWTLSGVSGTFPYVHIDGVTYTVQLETDGDYKETIDHVIPNRSRYYNIDLYLHQI